MRVILAPFEACLEDGPLMHITDTRVRPCYMLFPQHAHAPRCRKKKAHHLPYQRRFPRPILSQQPERRSPGHRQREVLQRRNALPTRLTDLYTLNHRHCHTSLQAWLQAADGELSIARAVASSAAVMIALAIALRSSARGVSSACCCASFFREGKRNWTAFTSIFRAIFFAFASPFARPSARPSLRPNARCCWIYSSLPEAGRMCQGVPEPFSCVIISLLLRNSCNQKMCRANFRSSPP